MTETAQPTIQEPCICGDPINHQPGGIFYTGTTDLASRLSTMSAELKALVDGINGDV